MLSNDEQSEKAYSSINITDDGIERVFNERHK